MPAHAVDLTQKLTAIFAAGVLLGGGSMFSKHRLAAQRLSAWRARNPHPWNRDKRVKEAA